MSKLGAWKDLLMIEINFDDDNDDDNDATLSYSQSDLNV